MISVDELRRTDRNLNHNLNLNRSLLYSKCFNRINILPGDDVVSQVLVYLEYYIRALKYLITLDVHVVLLLEYANVYSY